MTSTIDSPARIASAMAASRAAICSASPTTWPARPRGTNTTPLESAMTQSPAATGTPPIVTGSRQDSSTIRPRAVTGTAARAKSGNASLRASSTSRQAPSTITPATARCLAASDSSPPQAETSSRPR